MIIFNQILFLNLILYYLGTPERRLSPERSFENWNYLKKINIMPLSKQKYCYNSDHMIEQRIISNLLDQNNIS